MRKNIIKFNSLLMKLMLPMIVLAVVQGITFYVVYRITHKFEISIIVAIVLSALGVLLTSIFMSRPINKMSEEIKNNKSFNFTLNTKTNIHEIDVLVNEIRQLTLNLADSAVRLERIIELAKMPLGAYEYSNDDTKVFCTGRIHRLLNFSDKIMPSGFVPLAEFFGLMDSIKQNIYSTSEDGSEIVYRFASVSGINWTRLYVTNTAKGKLGVAVDITAEFTEKRILEHERDHDSLTQLLNRRAYYKLANELLKGSNDLGVAAVIMLDIDGLKNVNDTYGHDKGDRYIVSTAKAIRASCGDKAVAARLAGDEFSVILYGGESKDEIRRIANAIMDVLRKTIVTFTDGVEQRINASAGLAWFGDDATAFNKLLKYADYAMYQVKNTTKDDIAEFDYEKYSEEIRVLKESEEFREIIAKQKIEFAFQPVISTKTGTIFAYDIQYFGGMNLYKKQRDLIDAAVKTSLQYKLEEIVWIKILALMSEKNLNCTNIMFYSMPDCVPNERRLKDLYDYKKYINKMIPYGEPLDNAIITAKKEFMEMYGGGIAINVSIDESQDPFNLVSGLVRLDAQKLYDDYINTDKRLVMFNKIDKIKATGSEIIAYGVDTEDQYELMQSIGVHYLQGNFINPATTTPECLYKY